VVLAKHETSNTAKTVVEAETTQPPTTQAPTTETTAEASTTETTSAETPDEPATGGQVVVNNLVMTVPEDWAEAKKGEDLEAELAEKNPIVLAALEASGDLEQIKLVSRSVDWMAIPLTGGSITLVMAPPGQENTPLGPVIEGLKSGIESRGFTITGEEPHTSKIGDGTRITFDTITAIGGTGAAETRILTVGDRIAIFTSDSNNQEAAKSQLDLLIDGTEVTP